ncbi:MAG TPA: hypothetical protein VF326_15185 [Anaerolineaceae bacterium]
MKKTTILPYILRLLRNSAILEGVILIIVGVVGYVAKFSSYAIYGNFMFLAGILVLIVAGLSASGGVRQGVWANSMFLSLQRIVVQDDLSDANAEGVPGFFRTWGFSLFVALAALITILLGVLITTIYPA